MSEQHPAQRGSSPARRPHSLRRTLTLWFLALALLPMALVSWLGYRQATSSLTTAAAESLEQSARLSVEFIANWFDYRLMDLNQEAEDQHNAALLSDLSQGLRESGRSPAAYVKSLDWTRRVEGAQDDLVNFQRRYDYVHDLFLIDLQGNILFSTAHESDLGANLLHGPYAATRFARTVRSTLATGQALFSDLERYAPSGNAITGFLTAPLLDKFGERLGVFAIQLRVDRIAGLLDQKVHAGSSLVHYLVGADGRLRTAIGDAKDEVLERTIGHPAVQAVATRARSRRAAAFG